MLSKLCCLDSDACSCKCFGLTRNKNVKIGYIILLFIASGSLLLINSLMDAQSSSTIDRYGCNSGLPSVIQSQCVQDKNAELIFAGVGFLHLVMLCCMFLKSQKVKIINQGIWLVKVLIIVLAAIVFRLLVATSFFQYLSYFSIWGANFLYLFEAVVFVDLVYALDGAIDQCAKENPKIYILKAIISSTVLIAASFVCFLSFKYNPQWLCWINAGSLILFVILAVLRLFSENSILVAASVSLCLNILGFYIEEGGQAKSDYNTFLLAFKALFLVFLLLGMLCQGSSKLRTRKSTINELLALNTNANEEDDRYVSSNKWTVYHYVMMMIGVTIPALFCWSGEWVEEEVTNWLWINKLVWWAGVLACYIWSLVAMKLFPEQDFSDLQDYFREYELK